MASNGATPHASSIETALEGASIRESVSRRRLIFIVASTLLGMLLAALDQTIVGTAMPRIVADLQGLEHYAWVFTSYMLASTVTVPIYGKLSDIYGRRPFFIGGMSIFLLGSALSGLSQSMTQLILFRGIQGLGAGAMMPIAIALIGDVFPPAERGKWQGLLMGVFGLATVIGPSLGGWLTDNWGWQWVFYVNMPVGAVAIVAASLALPGQIRRSDHAIDYAGAAALIAGTVPLLLAFSWGGTEYAWSSAQIIGLLAVAAVMLVIFGVIETRVPEPIINPAFFRNRVFTVSVLATFLTSVGMFGAIMYIPLFIQGVIGQSATNSGAVMTPMMLGFVVSSIVAGQIMSRTGRYKVLALSGFAIAGVGMFLLSRMGVGATNGVVVRDMIVVGLGIGSVMSLFTIIVQNAFPFGLLGQVTASLQFFRSIGGTIGVALLGTVMTNRFQSAFNANLSPDLKQALPPEALAGLQDPQALLAPDSADAIRELFSGFGAQGQEMYNQFVASLRESLSVAITDLFMVGVLAMLAALAVTVLLPEIPLRKGHHEKDATLAGESIAAGPGDLPGAQPQRPADAAAERVP